MRRSMNTLALQVQERLKRDPHAGGPFVFRGKSGHLIKVPWHDGIRISLCAGRAAVTLWPAPSE
jgi:transposase